VGVGEASTVGWGSGVSVGAATLVTIGVETPSGEVLRPKVSAAIAAKISPASKIKVVSKVMGFRKLLKFSLFGFIDYLFFSSSHFISLNYSPNQSD
jgi:patatin-like phospholipase/acyl hydrolase